MACPSPSCGRAAVTNLVTNLVQRGGPEISPSCAVVTNLEQLGRPEIGPEIRPELRGDHEPIGRPRRRLLAPPRAPACNQGDHQWQSVAIRCIQRQSSGSELLHELLHAIRGNQRQSVAISGNQRQSSGSELRHELHLPIVVIVVVVVIIGCGSECRDQLAVRGVREESVRPQQRAQLVGGEAPKTARVKRRVGRHVTRG